ncbi:solute carrier family 2, facilitated glucose transporter member 3-like [Paramacrobiotus metropolitanus]|uniref:solute carrier family 2, facilitated glucose transporter member 3-like n=1 Tax=Paramacrobiotus metropolitanus TaxID=2943436 RepID=UPI002445C305|nr:solute carrier family 2, facilitated glucose transporter member 3-like [Paramacrobiotus metropolitanus]
MGHEDGVTGTLLAVVTSLSLGAWFPIGYSLCQINAPQAVIVDWLHDVRCARKVTNNTDFCIAVNSSLQLLQTDAVINGLWALIGASMSLGACLGLWGTGWLISRCGYKNALHVTNIPAVLGTILSGACVMADSYEMLFIGRILLGVNMGLSSSILPLYIAEISPVRLRGAMGTIPTFLYVFGMLVSVVLGLPQVLGTGDLWTVMSWLRFIPSLILSFSLLFCPESPRYLLLTNGDHQAAAKALTWLRQRSNITYELQQIELERKAVEGEKVISVVGLFRDPFLRQNIVTCGLVMMNQRFSGYAAVYPYSSAIFSSVGLPPLESLYGSIGVMGLQMLAIAAGMVLIDKAGRKVLLISGNIGCCVACIAMVTFSGLVQQNCRWCPYGGLAALLTFIVSYNLGPGIVPWILPAEMFGKESRGAAMTLVSFACHASTMLVTALYPPMQAGMGHWTFLPYAIAAAAFIVYIWYDVLETKGRSFSEIQEALWEKRTGRGMARRTTGTGLSHAQSTVASTAQLTDL